MKFRFAALCGLNILFLLILVAGCSKREQIVAQIGRTDVITLGELREDFLKMKAKQSLQSDDLPELKKRLDQLINQRVKTVTAYDYGVDRDSTVLVKIEPIRKQQLINRLYETEIVDQVLKESHIRENYAQTGKEVIIRTIAFLCPLQTSQEEEGKIKEKALNVLQKIRSGEDFAELATKHSEDKNSAMNGGLMKPLSFTIKDDPVRRAAFSMREGQVSDVLKDDLSYQIIKIEKIRHKERKPYNQVREELRRQLMTAKRQELSAKARVYWQDLMEENLVHWHEDVLNFLIERMESLKNPIRDAVLDGLKTLNVDEKQRPLVHYKGGKITIHDFQVRLGMMPAHMRIPIDNKLKSLIEQWLMGDMLSEKALRKGLDKDVTMRNEVKNVLEREMVQVLTQRHILGEMNPSDEEIMAYFEKNKKQKYLEPEQVTVQEVMVKDEELAKRIASWAKAGRNFDELAREYTERAGYKRKAGVLSYFRRGRWGAVGEKAFTLGMGEVTDPIAVENNRGYSVIKLLGRKPARIRSFEEVQNRIENDLKNDLRKEREEVWLSEKKKEYNVQIFEKVLEDAVINES